MATLPKPKPPAKKAPKGLTARQILAETPLRTREGARYCRVSAAEPKVNRQGKAELTCITFSVADLDGNPKVVKGGRYRTTVTAVVPGERLSVGNVKVKCECDAHVYWGGEWALAKHGAADILFGNGQPPKVRNPLNIPWACKHAARVLAEIIKKKV